MNDSIARRSRLEVQIQKIKSSDSESNWKYDTA